MGDELNRESKKVGLIMNLSKTKIMSNGTEEEFLVDGQKIEYVSEYSYLGLIISFEDRGSKELRKRAAKAWSNFWAHNTILRSNMSIDKKMKVFNPLSLMEPKRGP